MQNRRPEVRITIRRLGEDQLYRQLLTLTSGLVVILSVVAYVLTG